MANGKAGAPKGHKGNPTGINQHSGIFKKQLVLRIPSSMAENSDWIREAITSFLDAIERGEIDLDKPCELPYCDKRIGLRLTLSLYNRLSKYRSTSDIIKRAIVHSRAS